MDNRVDIVEKQEYTERIDRLIDEKRARIKDIDQLKVRGDVFDENTLHALYKLSLKNWITAVGGPISTGKEANVFLAERNEALVAIKIYLIRTANFKRMQEYIAGDRRFHGTKKTRKELIFTWTRKEFSNLKRAKKAGISVPEPLVFDRNILVMEFLGKGEEPYPQLRNAVLQEPQQIYEEIISQVTVLYQSAQLVHGDLSEYNILYGDKTYLIDVGQAVTTEHPAAHSFLVRDLENVTRFFADICATDDVPDLFRTITGIPMMRRENKQDRRE